MAPRTLHRRIGRAVLIDPAKLAYAEHLRDTDHAITEIITKTGIPRTSLYRHLPPRPPEQLTAAAPANPADNQPTGGPPLGRPSWARWCTWPPTRCSGPSTGPTATGRYARRAPCRPKPSARSRCGEGACVSRSSPSGRDRAAATSRRSCRPPLLPHSAAIMGRLGLLTATGITRHGTSAGASRRHQVALDPATPVQLRRGNSEERQLLAVGRAWITPAICQEPRRNDMR